jgi:hypothetical protein
MWGLRLPYSLMIQYEYLLDLVLDLLVDHRILAISVVDLDLHLVPRCRTRFQPRKNKHRKRENNTQHGIDAMHKQDV